MERPHVGVPADSPVEALAKKQPRHSASEINTFV